MFQGQRRYFFFSLLDDRCPGCAPPRYSTGLAVEQRCVCMTVVAIPPGCVSRPPSFVLLTLATQQRSHAATPVNAPSTTHHWPITSNHLVFALGTHHGPVTCDACPLALHTTLTSLTARHRFVSPGSIIAFAPMPLLVPCRSPTMHYHPNDTLPVLLLSPSLLPPWPAASRTYHAH